VRLDLVLPALALLIGIGNAGAQNLPPLTSGLTVIDAAPAPPLVRENLDGEPVDIAAFKGDVVVVNFWATWCPPCRREMSSLERMHRALSERGVTVLAVNVGEDFETVFGFLGAVDPSPTFPILFDRDGSALDAWGVKGLPTTFVVSPDGRLAYRAIGGRQFDHPDMLETLSKIANRN
jgi:thiol-disulfide isomerase/thioredoxin